MPSHSLRKRNPSSFLGPYQNMLLVNNYSRILLLYDDEILSTIIIRRRDIIYDYDITLVAVNCIC